MFLPIHLDHRFWILDFRKKTIIHHLKSKISRVKRGFTLIELLTVITIISILVAAATVSYTKAQQKGRDGKRKSDLKAVQQVLELYFQTYGRYPTSSGGVITCSGGSAGTGNNNWNAVFQCPPSTGPILLQRLPQDPVYQSTNGYYYNGTSATTYVLSADLENNNDPERSTGSSPSCTTPQLGRDYCAINP